MLNKNFNVGTIALGLTYAGSFFGAGYVSGNELYEFFGSFGLSGYVGLALAIGLFIFFGILLVRTVQLCERTSLDRVIILPDLKIPRFLLGAVTIFMMFGVFVVMAAGTGALINQIFDVPYCLGGLIFTVIVCFATMHGISGTVKAFSALVPILVITTIIISVAALYKYGFTFEIQQSNKNPLLGNWWFSALTYVSYNMVTLIGTMIPVSTHVKKKSTVYTGIIFGCILALSIALGILISVTSIYGAQSAELPMLDIAFRLGNIFGYIYAFLLIVAMFGTSLSCFVAIVVYFEEKSKSVSKHKKLFIIIMGVFAFLGSLAGFGNLINTVYPVFGYVGFIVLALIISNFLYLKFLKFKSLQ